MVIALVNLARGRHASPRELCMSGIETLERNFLGPHAFHGASWSWDIEKTNINREASERLLILASLQPSAGSAGADDAAYGTG